MRKSTYGFPFLSYMSMGLRLAALLAAGASPLLPDLFGWLQAGEVGVHSTCPLVPIARLVSMEWHLTASHHVNIFNGLRLLSWQQWYDLYQSNDTQSIGVMCFIMGTSG